MLRYCKNRLKNSGFTLVEMAIVILIFGFIIAGFSSAYALYQKKIKIDTTQENIATISDAIGAFRSLYGRYPCPSSLTVQRDSADYGRENCDLMITNPVGTPVDNNGIGIQPSIRTAANTYMRPDHNGTEFTGTFTTVSHLATPMRIAMGAIPFKNLDLQEEQAYDGYDNRVVYAVTEHLAFADAFQITGGGIEIRNDDNKSALGELPENQGTAHFLVFSPGVNEEGAFTQSGTQYACPATGIDAENCDFTDSIFRAVQTSEGDAAQDYDDVMTYFTQKEVPLWQLSESSGFESDAHNKVEGLVGFGVDQNDIDQEMRVNNTMRVADDPATTDPEGFVKAEELCISSSDSECFQSQLLGGLIAQQGGMECPSGEYMAGIANGAPICRDEVIARCPSGTFMVGIEDNGELKCSDPPPDGCGKKTVRLCSEDVEIGPAKHNQEVWAGIKTASRKQKYICQNGEWSKVGGESGQCTCTPVDWRTSNNTCSTTKKGNCGYPYVGDRVQETRYVCPANDWETRTKSGSCQCIGSQSDIKTKSCGTGYNVGEIKGRDVFNCSTQQCKFEVTSNTCGCRTDQNSDWVNCPSNYEGQYRKLRDFTCSNGADQPGQWGSWYNDPANGIEKNCVCKPRTLSDRVESCQDGYEGKISYPRRVECDASGKPDTVEGPPVYDCEPIPKQECKWTAIGQSIDDGRIGRKANESCECGTNTQSCSSGDKIYNCVCK